MTQGSLGGDGKGKTKSTERNVDKETKTYVQKKREEEENSISGLKENSGQLVIAKESKFVAVVAQSLWRLSYGLQDPGSISGKGNDGIFSSFTASKWLWGPPSFLSTG
jgi:hypothetical protein